jgi:hypothetical protein
MEVASFAFHLTERKMVCWKEYSLNKQHGKLAGETRELKPVPIYGGSRLGAAQFTSY